MEHEHYNPKACMFCVQRFPFSERCGHGIKITDMFTQTCEKFLGQDYVTTKYD